MAVAPGCGCVFTLVAATAQTFRNAAQRSLTGTLGTVGATHVRFLFGLPFGILALLVVARLAGGLPTPNLASLGWTALRRVEPDRGDRADARRHARALLRRHHRLHQDRAGPGGALRGRLPRRASSASRLPSRSSSPPPACCSCPGRRAAAREAFSWRPAVLGLVSGGLFALVGGRLSRRHRRARHGRFRAGRDARRWPSR